MYEYELVNKTTGEHIFIYGYDWQDAQAKAKGIDFAQWIKRYTECIDQAIQPSLSYYLGSALAGNIYQYRQILPR